MTFGHATGNLSIGCRPVIFLRISVERLISSLAMKGWIIAALCGMLAGVSAADSMDKGDVVAIIFTREGTANGTAKGSVLGQTNAVVNAVCAEARFAVPGNLVLSNTAGETVDVRVTSWVNQGATATRGTVARRLRPAQGRSYQTVFGQDTVTGSTYGGALNAHLNGQSIALTLGGLTPGQEYELYMLTGRGNTTWSVPAADKAITYSLSGADHLKSELIGASNTRTALQDNRLLSFERNTDDRVASSNGAWSLVKWSFTADETGTVTISTDADGNVNALALKATGDDPAAARQKFIVLGSAGAVCILLMLALILASRRHQKEAKRA